MHLLVWDGGELVAHACWVTRWLQPEGLPLLRTAYVMTVAVAPERQRQGWGRLAMRHLCEHAATAGYELCALSTVIPEYYARFGWEQWRGSTAIRADEGLLLTPDKRPMILPTAKTPPLDLGALLTSEWRGEVLW